MAVIFSDLPFYDEFTTVQLRVGLCRPRTASGRTSVWPRAAVRRLVRRRDAEGTRRQERDGHGLRQLLARADRGEDELDAILPRRLVETAVSGNRCRPLPVLRYRPATA